MMNRQQAEAMSPEVLAAWEHLERVQPSSNPFSHFGAYEAIIDALVEVVGEQAGMLGAAYVHEYDSMKKLRMGYDAWADELRQYAAHDAQSDHKEADN